MAATAPGQTGQEDYLKKGQRIDFEARDEE
jgi:hypothetical protein